MLEGLPLDVILRIFSLLSMEELLQVSECSQYLRRLANHAWLKRNVLTSANSNLNSETLSFNMSQEDLEFLRQERRQELEKQQESYDERLLMNMYAEAIMSNSDEGLSYMKILQGDRELVSPDYSDYSKSSTNSTFSELPAPRLSNSSEWSSPIEELNTLSDENSDSESTDSLDKLRSSKKVKDKAALFEKLIMKDAERAARSQSKSMKKKSYGLLSHFFPEHASNASDRNISQDYIDELARCNGKSTAPTATAQHIGPQNMHKDDDKLERTRTEESMSKTTPSKNNSKGSGTHRNRLKAFVTEESRICYEKI